MGNQIFHSITSESGRSAGEGDVLGDSGQLATFLLGLENLVAMGEPPFHQENAVAICAPLGTPRRKHAGMTVLLVF